MVTEAKGEKRDVMVSFRNRGVERELDRRRRPGQGRGARVSADMLRYYALLALELREITLSEGEALVIAAVLRDEDLDDPGKLPRMLWSAVAEAVDDGRAAGVDGPKLVAWLRDLPAGAAFALADAVERANLAIDDGVAPAQALAEAGLLK